MSCIRKYFKLIGNFGAKIFLVNISISRMDTHKNNQLKNHSFYIGALRSYVKEKTTH